MDTALNLRDLPRVALDQIATVQFSSTEVYSSQDDMRARIVSLDKAITMGRSPLIKTLLAVKTTDGFKAVEAKIIGMNLQGVLLENNAFVPMHAIYSVNIE